MAKFFLYICILAYVPNSLFAGANSKLELGRMLFFDKILSGNKNISCASCHHPRLGTSDGLSLGVGEGGVGLGKKRSLGKGKYAVHERVPRNSPAIFNLGHSSFKMLFHDGRIKFALGFPSGIKSPAGPKLPNGLNSLLAAQALFPLQSGTEMAGQENENPIGLAASKGDLSGTKGVWSLLTKRVQNTPGYFVLFQKAYSSEINHPSDISIVHIANAIGEFEKIAFKSFSSRFDYHLSNSSRFPLTNFEQYGQQLFYGKANCSSCHSGPLFTDNKFHSIALPPIGRGKGDGPEKLDDFGLSRETHRTSDKYKFRTPSLRNLSHTAPYGHNGSYSSLYGIIKHHLDSEKMLKQYGPKRAKIVLPYRADLARFDFKLLKNREVIEAISQSSDLEKIELSNKEIYAVIAFLKTLDEVDYAGKYLKLVPNTVPSGIRVDR
jgi:cytochrome c peroxidase